MFACTVSSVSVIFFLVFIVSPPWAVANPSDVISKRYARDWHAAWAKRQPLPLIHNYLVGLSADEEGGANASSASYTAALARAAQKAGIKLALGDVQMAGGKSAR